MEDRQLAAIMFTDIVGYTSMMNRDEFRTLEIVRHFRNLQKSLINNFRGTWLKEMGDGTLAYFKSALDAVNCSIEIQKVVRSELDILIRIGIHLGDITFENEDVFGTGVNIASRIQSIADPGGIYISDTIYNVINSVPEIHCRYLGEFKLKNVKDSLNVYAIQGNGLPKPTITKKKGHISHGPSRMLPVIISVSIIVFTVIAFLLFRWLDRAPAVSGIKSIAVLPFVNLSGDPNQEFFSDGITEALIVDLSKISALKIIGRTSVMKYKESDKSLSEIARELNVDAILEGSVIREGDQVSISAQLINAYNDMNIWAERYERNLNSILRLYSEVAQVIASEIEINLLPEEQNNLENVRLVNPEAYEAYLKGKAQLYKISLANYDSAFYYFNLSLQIDSSNALAYAGLAQYWNHVKQWGGIDPSFGISKMREALKKAELLDSSLADLHFIRALIYTSYEWNWTEAVKSYERTIQLYPNLPVPRLLYGDLLLSLHKSDEAFYQIRRALEIDPLNAFSHSILGWAHYAMKDFAKAIPAFNTCLEIDSANSLALRCMWSISSMKREYDKAILYAIRFYRSQGNYEIVADLQKGFQSVDYESVLKRTADHALQNSERKYVPSMRIARLYTFCHEYETAIDLLEMAYEERFPSMFSLNVDPHWDVLRGNPRFNRLIKLMNFPEE